MKKVSNIFNLLYADLYDDVYKDKAYSAEVNYIIKSVMINHSRTNGKHRVLDFGCGTGSHALEFCRHGFEVLGIDASRYMIKKARQKALLLNYSEQAEFKIGSIDKIPRQDFNLICCLFNAFGYFSATNDPLSLLQLFHSSLIQKNGNLVIEFWDKARIDSKFEEQSSRIFRTQLGDAVRKTKSSLFESEILQIDITWELENQSNIRTVERHLIRLFDKTEFKNLLIESGFVNAQEINLPKGKYTDSRNVTFLATIVN